MNKLLENGIEHIFVSNTDNLGAVLDLKIFGFFIENKLPFLMEVTDRRMADRKGGHLAVFKNGHYILRESAQCPKQDKENFQNVRRHRYFNTNNLWINLKALDKLQKKKKYILKLPMIRNGKTVDPRDPESTPVYQLETAMGSAISVFDGAQAIRVPRSRFAPVKNTGDLLAVRSDCYILDHESKIIPNPARTRQPLRISLDENFYKLVDDFEARFPFGAPSLVECSEFKVSGDVVFGKGIKCKSKVKIVNTSGTRKEIADHSLLEGEIIL